jgi:hypothetical protein
MASTSYDHRQATARRKVSVTRLYEVECSQCCGVIDSRRRRSDAEQAAREHRRLHREHPERFGTQSSDLRQGGEPFLFRRR